MYYGFVPEGVSQGKCFTQCLTVKHKRDATRVFMGLSYRCNSINWACFLSLARSKLRLCSANHRTGYFSNLACDWLSIVWAYSQQETEIGPWSDISLCLSINFMECLIAVQIMNFSSSIRLCIYNWWCIKILPLILKKLSLALTDIFNIVINDENWIFRNTRQLYIRPPFAPDGIYVIS